MKNIGVHHPYPQLQHKIQYVLDFLNSHPLNCYLHFVSNQNAVINISYGVSKKGYYQVPYEDLYSYNEIQKDLFANLNKTNQGELIYSVSKTQRSTELLKSGHIFSFDIFSNIFFHLSRVEEYYTQAEENLFCIKNKINQSPVVDQIVHAIVAYFSHQNISIASSYTMSHDIDHIEKFRNKLSGIKKIVGHISRMEWEEVLPFIQSYRKYLKNQKDPFDNFDRLLLDSEKIAKRIYFLIGGNTAYDSPTPSEHPFLQKAIRYALEKKYIIGIHPSYNSYKDDKIYRREKQLLEKITRKTITHSRQHYLNFEFQNTISILENNKIYEDSSISYKRHIGFRAGTGFPYLLYDLACDRVSTIRELPLVIMDSALIKKHNYNYTLIENEVLDFLAQHKYNTHITFNFHNSRFDEAMIKGYDLYQLYHLIVKTICKP